MAKVVTKELQVVTKVLQAVTKVLNYNFNTNN